MKAGVSLVGQKTQQDWVTAPLQRVVGEKEQCDSPTMPILTGNIKDAPMGNPIT